MDERVRGRDGVEGEEKAGAVEGEDVAAARAAGAIEGGKSLGQGKIDITARRQVRLLQEDDVEGA